MPNDDFGNSSQRELRESNFRIPPQAIEVEKHVLGGLFLDGDSVGGITTILQKQDFYLEKHDLIFRAIENLAAGRVVVDIVTVTEELRRIGKLDQVTESYLMEVSMEVVSSANIEQHARIIKEKSNLRKVIATATRILDRAYNDRDEPGSVIEYAESEIYLLGESARGAMEGLIDMPTSVLRMVKQLEDTAAGKPNRIRIGIPAVDDIMRGLRFGGLYILAARPGFGKSAMALQAAVTCGLPVPFFSMEMMIEEELERMMAHEDPTLNANGISTQALVIAKRQAIADVLAKLSKYPIEFCDSSNLNIPFVRSECQRMKRKHGKLGLIGIDYLQMMEAVGSHGRRDLEVGSISTGLKKIGNQLATPVLAVASLSRKCEERDNKRPIPSDLRDAGQIESDAHGIIFLYRESAYSPKAKRDPRIANITEIIIPKNRGGETGRTLADFDGARSWFRSVSKDQQTYYQNFLSGKDFNGEEGEEKATGKKKPKGLPNGPWHNGGASDPELL